MNTRSTFLVSMLLFAIILVGIWVGVSTMSQQNANPNAPSKYSAVYLTSGDVYFGKLHWLPWPHLTDVYFLQHNTTDPSKPAFLVVRLTSVFWSPIDSLYLNPKQILFWTRLRQQSDIVSGIESQNTQQQTMPQSQAPITNIPTQQVPVSPTAPATTSHATSSH
jgi:hypothetical protein